MVGGGARTLPEWLVHLERDYFSRSPGSSRQMASSFGVLRVFPNLTVSAFLSLEFVAPTAQTS